MSAFRSAWAVLDGVEPVEVTGRVAALRGMTVLVDELPAPVGSTVRVGSKAMPGEVVGFNAAQAVVMMLGTTSGIRAGDAVLLDEVHPTAPVGISMLGRVVNGLGEPIDGRGPIRDRSPAALSPKPIGPMERRTIRDQLHTGVRVIDLMTPLGVGQRLGIFAGPGVGKSTLLGQIARGTEAACSVIALIGERGREVRESVEHALGEEGLARSIVVVATGDESPLLRIRAAKLACAAAEHLRDDGRDVVLMMDSVTRFAHAQRQVGLSVGEPPATRGYTPSVFAEMGQLLERAGALDSATGSGGSGSVTGLYTVLVEGDDMTEPVSDAARGILDGHVMLSRKLAHKGHFPAVDPLDSVSRVADAICPRAHTEARRQITRLLAAHVEIAELVQIGAYARGSSPEGDTALDYERPIEEPLTQRSDEIADPAAAKQAMIELAMASGELLAERVAASGGAAVNHAGAMQGGAGGRG